MISMKLNMARPRLDDWGTPEDWHDQTVNGSPRISGTIYFGTEGSDLIAGIWECSRGTFRTTYPFHEHATVLEGEVALTDEGEGTTSVYSAGDSWFIKKGQRILWDIRSSALRKSFLVSSIDQDQ